MLSGGSHERLSSLGHRGITEHPSSEHSSSGHPKARQDPKLPTDHGGQALSACLIRADDLSRISEVKPHSVRVKGAPQAARVERVLEDVLGGGAVEEGRGLKVSCAWQAARRPERALAKDEAADRLGD